MDSCILTSNVALYGGGAYGGTLNNCLLAGNSATNSGGGACAEDSPVLGGGWIPVVLNNCTVLGNTAQTGGGVFEGAVNNSIVYANNAATNPNYDSGTLNYCCTFPLPASGEGNISKVPGLIDYGDGDPRLQSNSPCINSGNNSYASDPTDLDGNPRIAGGTVDIGAYEFQSPRSLISYAWLQQYGLPTDGFADSGDPDADGLNNWQEWRCLTDPTNASSALRLISAVPTENGVTITWRSVPGVSYFLERSTNRFIFSTVATNIPGQPDATAYDDTDAAPALSVFYRVGVGS